MKSRSRRRTHKELKKRKKCSRFDQSDPSPNPDLPYERQTRASSRLDHICNVLVTYVIDTIHQIHHSRHFSRLTFSASPKHTYQQHSPDESKMSSCMLKPIRSSGLWIPTNIPRTRIHAYQQFNIKTPTAARITSISTSIHRRHQTGQVPTQRPLQTLCFWKCRHTWKRATVNTTRCLIGCSLGDLSTMYYLMTYHPSMSTATSMSISSEKITQHLEMTVN